MHDEIGTEAAVIWQALDGKGALSLRQLKKEVKGKSPLFEMGDRLARARRQDRDHSREALIPR